MEPTQSPSFERGRDAAPGALPAGHVPQPGRLSPTTNAVEGARIATGQPLASVVDYSRARRVLSIDCDFLGAEPGSVRNQRRWAQSRRLDGPQADTARLYVVESTLSVNG